VSLLLELEFLDDVVSSVDDDFVSFITREELRTGVSGFGLLFSPIAEAALPSLDNVRELRVPETGVPALKCLLALAGDDGDDPLPSETRFSADC